MFRPSGSGSEHRGCSDHRNKETETNKNERITKTNGRSMKHRNADNGIISTFVKLSFLSLSVMRQIWKARRMTNQIYLFIVMSQYTNSHAETPFGICSIYVILTISYLRAQTIETSSLPTDSSRPLFEQIEIFSIYWLHICTVSTVLNIRASY